MALLSITACLNVLVGEVLHLGVDRQLEVTAVGRRDLVADVLDDAAQAVLDDHARAVLALQVAWNASSSLLAWSSTSVKPINALRLRPRGTCA